jgi:Flp pilus assembly protein TadG
MDRRFRSRRGATIVEFAVVAPVVFLLIFGVFIGGLGVFRYQQIAYLSREASRYASVHGAEYASETKKGAATRDTIYNQIIVPKATGLDLSKLTLSVTWDTDNRQFHTRTVNGNLTTVANTVTVALTYVWIPELYVGSTTLRSTSVSVMSF